MSPLPRLALALALASSAALAAGAELWYEDNNLGKAGGVPPDFVEKFRRPETFRNATRFINVYMMRANTLSTMDDSFFTELLLPYLKANRIRLAINAGGATWALAPGRDRLYKDDIELYRRLKRLGAEVSYISLQSVLSKPRRGEKAEFPLDKRIEGVVAYAKEAHAIYPNAQFGIIDALPSHGKEYAQPYRRLKDAMAKAGTPLAYVQLDANFQSLKEGRGESWDGARQVERFVEQDLGLKFGFFTGSRKHGQTSSKAFHDAVLASLDCYDGASGTPDHFIVASFYRFPDKTIPEDATGDDYPAMRIVLDVGRRLAQISKPANEPGTKRTSEPAWRASCQGR